MSSRKRIRVKKSSAPDLLDLDDDEIEEKLKSKARESPGRRARAAQGTKLVSTRAKSPPRPSTSQRQSPNKAKDKGLPNKAKDTTNKAKHAPNKAKSPPNKEKATTNPNKEKTTPNKEKSPISKKRKRESDAEDESPARKKTRVNQSLAAIRDQFSDVIVSIEPLDEDVIQSPARHVSSDSDEAEDSYFDQRETTSSGHTLTGVKLLDTKDVHVTVAQLADTHQAEKLALIESYREQFAQWWCQLRSGFNLLFYGLGSKKALLEALVKQHCQHALIVVNGYFPNLTVKAILNAIVTKVLNVQDASVSAQFKSVHEQVEYLEHVMQRQALIRSPRVKSRLHQSTKRYESVPAELTVLIHNIDGPALRGARSQELLSLLARIKQIHLVASTDHVNAALLWDNRQLDRFAWLWHHVPTYARLQSETSYEGQISDQFAARRPGGRRGALQVLQTLPAKARQIFLVLARAQLDGQRGIEFEQYLAQCQEQFLTSTSTVFKATLGEFVDHQLIQMKRASDGALYCSTPLHPSTLKQILDEMARENLGTV